MNVRAKLRRHRLAALVAAGAVVLLAGCTSVSRTSLVTGSGGSVASGASGNTPGGAGGAATGSAASHSPTSVASSGPSGSAGVSHAATETGAAGPAPSEAGGASTGSSRAASPTGAAAAASSPACKQGPIKIGISYSSDEGQALAAFGAGPNAGQAASTATNYAQYATEADQTMASYVNSHGGLGPDCQIVLSFHDFHILGSDGFTGESQSECTDFAQDQHVFMAVSDVEETGLIIPCLAQAHVVDVFDSSEYSPSPTDFAKYQSYLYQPSSMTPYRFGSFMSLLKQYNFFGLNSSGQADPHPVVGILLADQGDGHNQYLVNNLWVPALKAMGIPTSVYTYTNGNGSEASISSETSSFSSAVLQFRTAGVDHVLFTPDGGNAVFVFPPVANGAEFDPRYGMTTANGAAAWTLATPGEQGNAMAVSYSPFDTIGNGGAGNTNLTQYNTNPKNSSQTVCAQIFSGHLPSGETIQDMYPVCDQFFWIQDSLKGASSVTPATLQAGVDRLGNSFVAAGDYANPDFAAPDHYDGESAVRVMTWNKPQESWDYVSPVTPIPLYSGPS